jgi:hypothetical protein
MIRPTSIRHRTDRAGFYPAARDARLTKFTSLDAPFIRFMLFLVPS